MGVFLGLVRWVGALALLTALAGAVMAQPVPSGATRWITLRGQAADLALTPGGDALALDEHGLVWKLSGNDIRAGNTGGWSKQPGQFRRLRAGQDGSFWGIDAEGMLYRLTGSLWRPVAERVRDVAVSPDGLVWLLDAAGQLVSAENGVPFQPAPPVAAVSLMADEHGLPWLRYGDGAIQRFDGVHWQSAALPADGLRGFAIGADGSVYAIGANGEVLRRQAETGRWVSTPADASPPPARHLAVGAEGLPWLILTNGELLAERFVAPVETTGDRRPAVFTRLLTWTPVGGGTARQISLGDDGTAFSVAPDGAVWRWQGGSNWSPIAGRLATIAAGSDGRAWGLDENGRVRRLEAGFWRDLPGHARLIAVGPRDSVWIFSGDALSVWDETSHRWQAMTNVPFAATWFAIGAAGEPWLIDAEGKVQMWQQNRWTPVPGITAQTLDVGSDGTVYTTTREQAIYWLDRREMQWKPATGRALQIAVGPGGAPWIVAPGNQLMASGRFLAERAVRAEAVRAAQAAATTKPVLTIVAGPLPTLTKPLVFQLLAGDVRVRDIGIGANGAVFAVSGEGSLLCFSNPTKSFVLASSGQSARVAVASNGSPWILGSNGIVAHFEKGAWRSVPEFSAQDIASGPDGRLWAAGIDGESYRYATASSRFERVPVLRSDAPVKAKRIAGANDGAHWIISGERQLFRCDKGDCRLQLTGAQDIAVAPDNTVFALDLLGNVQKFNASKKQFEKQNGEGQAIAVGPQGLPWLVTASGQVQHAGLFFPNSKTVNTADCANQFALAQTPVSAPNAALRASDDIVTSLPGGSIAILANDSFNGRVPKLADVNVLLESADGLLRLSGESVLVASNVTTGTVLRASYRICPKVVFGSCAAAKITVTVSGVPNAPTGASAVAGNAQATVTFTAPASAGGSAITSYTATSNPGGITASGAASPLTVTGLANGTAYTFTVTATNAVGTSAASTASSSVTPAAAATAPGAPTNVVISSASATSVNVTVTAPASNGGSALTNYTVTSNPGGITGSNDADTLLISGLTTGVSYTFTATATNAIGTGPASAASNGVTPGVPLAPTNVTATPGGVGELVVSFTPGDLGGGALMFHGVDCQPVFQGTGMSGVGATAPITVSGLSSGISYTCKVFTQNDLQSGTGPWSASSNAAVAP
ncbi:MAG: fibronectin type III domain-containing protein [Sulfuritalea sp.]|nr:fibronectin type III domain-containing protein [Sulfuritalea sp.]MDP1981616.1 fibronectin type III domain-containing protein [Sulfuritalea sp.]